MSGLQVSDGRIGVEPAEHAPRLERIVLPLTDGEVERHVLALTGALARAAHAEVLLVAADSVTARRPARMNPFGTGAHPAAPTLLSTSRSLARGEAALRARGVRVSGYLVRAAADAVSLIARVIAQQPISMVIVPIGKQAKSGIEEGLRSALAMAVPTLLVSAITPKPWTSAILRGTEVVVPSVAGEGMTVGVLWAEALAQYTGRSIVEIRPRLPERATWQASGMHLRQEVVVDYATALAQLSRHTLSIVVLPYTPGLREDRAFRDLLRALECSGLPTLVVPYHVTAPAGTN
jgi:hypothetical protein